jgi:hypothetical protein
MSVRPGPPLRGAIPIALLSGSAFDAEQAIAGCPDLSLDANFALARALAESGWASGTKTSR